MEIQKIKSINGGKQVSFVTYLKEALIRGTIEMLKTQKKKVSYYGKLKVVKSMIILYFKRIVYRVLDESSIHLTKLELNIQRIRYRCQQLLKEKCHPRNHLKRKRYKNDKKKRKKANKIV